MKKIKLVKQIQQGDYIKAINKGKFIIFKAQEDFSSSWNSNKVEILDLNIAGLESMIGKIEYLSKFSLEHEFALYRLNKYERWQYII